MCINSVIDVIFGIYIYDFYILFTQGVAKSFSAAHQYVDIRKKTLRITESALAWIHRRSPSVLEINVYIVEPDEQVG